MKAPQTDGGELETDTDSRPFSGGVRGEFRHHQAASVGWEPEQPGSSAGEAPGGNVWTAAWDGRQSESESVCVPVYGGECVQKCVWEGVSTCLLQPTGWGRWQDHRGETGQLLTQELWGETEQLLTQHHWGETKQLLTQEPGKPWSIKGDTLWCSRDIGGSSKETECPWAFRPHRPMSK